MIFPNFQNCACYEKCLKDNKLSSLHLARKFARKFVLGHYLFHTEVHSFPRATLSENCSSLGTDNVRGQICEHIFASNRGYCLFNISFLKGRMVLKCFSQLFSKMKCKRWYLLFLVFVFLRCYPFIQDNNRRRWFSLMIKCILSVNITT